LLSEIDPRARTEKLDDDTIRDLHRTMHKVLQQAIDAHDDVEKVPGPFYSRNGLMAAPARAARGS
jgi:hypothetical protein